MQLIGLLDGLVLAVDVDSALLHVLSNLRSAFLIKSAAATSQSALVQPKEAQLLLFDVK